MVKIRKFDFNYKYKIKEELKNLTEQCMEFNHNRNDSDIQNCFRCTAFGFKRNNLIEIGYNKYGLCPVKFKKFYESENKRYYSTHAEIDLITALMKNDILSLITDIVLIRGAHTPLPSYPCSKCRVFIKKYFKNKTLWYYNSNKKLTYIKI